MSDGSAGSYQRLRWLARLTVLLLGLFMLVRLVAAMARYGQILLVGDILAGAPFPEAAWETSFARAGMYAYAGMGLYAMTAITFLAWVYWAYRNLHAFGAQGLQHSTGWAVGAWFVPFVNLWRPYEVVREIYHASDPDLDPSVPVAWAPNHPWLLRLWWAVWVGQGLMNSFAQSVGKKADTLQLFVRASWWQIGADLVTVTGAMLAAMTVLAVTARQEARWERLQAEPASADSEVGAAEP